ncbi:hypothetical protein [Caldimonas sp. KR1-144]|uniref:hypothetical protein n=1 Tax=Caldimonas sp. KR1-144 TaxID=3400911 RepID=UPI003C09B4BE
MSTASMRRGAKEANDESAGTKYGREVGNAVGALAVAMLRVKEHEERIEALEERIKRLEGRLNVLESR